MEKYETIIFWSDEDQAFIAEVPQLPGCMAHGNTQEEALKNAMDAAKSWLETAREFNDPIPKPDEFGRGKFVTRVPRSLHTRLAARAKQEGVSMNALITAFLAESLGKREAHR